MTSQLSNQIDLTKLYDLVDELAKLYKNEIQNADAKASGQLFNFTHRIDWNGEMLKVLFSLPDYWYYLEYGRGPTHKSEGGKLIEAIRQWIRLKGIAPRDGDAESLAWAVTKAIHKRGYFGSGHHGKHLLRNAMDRAKGSGLISKISSSVVDEYNKEIKVDLADLNNRTSLK